MVLLYLRYLYLELPGNSLAIYVTYFRPGSTGRALWCDVEPRSGLRGTQIFFEFYRQDAILHLLQLSLIYWDNFGLFIKYWIFTALSFPFYSNSEELDLPDIYWIPKMHKNPYKHIFIAGSSKCSTKPLSIILTKLLTHIKQGLQKYCETAYSRSGSIRCGSSRIQKNY